MSALLKSQLPNSDSSRTKSTGSTAALILGMMSSIQGWLAPAFQAAFSVISV